MKLAAGLSVAAGLVGLVCWLVRHRKPMRGRPAGPPRDVQTVTTASAWAWQWPFTFALSWSPFFTRPYVALPSTPRQVWAKSQVIAATSDGDDIILDCLVPVHRRRDGGRGTVSVPMTLRTHQLPARQPVDRVDAAMATWTTTSAFVDIVVDRDEDCAVVSIRGDASTITLELTASSPTG
jgi:hypothetical protein